MKRNLESDSQDLHGNDWVSGGEWSDVSMNDRSNSPGIGSKPAEQSNPVPISRLGATQTGFALIYPHLMDGAAPFLTQSPTTTQILMDGAQSYHAEVCCCIKSTSAKDFPFGEYLRKADEQIANERSYGWWYGGQHTTPTHELDDPLAAHVQDTQNK